MMQWETQLAMIGIITVLAVISPGPDFAVTTKNSLMHGRQSGLATAAGIAAGVSVHIVYTLLGLGYVLAEALWLLEAMKYCGAAYLIWLGVCSFRTQVQNAEATTQQPCDQGASHWRAFRTGFVCNALNPKTALFFIALFTQVVDPATPAIVQIFLGLFIAAAHLIWFAIVALLLTHARFKAKFDRCKTWIERGVGVCLIGLGGKLALSS